MLRVEIETIPLNIDLAKIPEGSNMPLPAAAGVAAAPRTLLKWHLRWVRAMPLLLRQTEEGFQIPANLPLC